MLQLNATTFRQIRASVRAHGIVPVRLERLLSLPGDRCPQPDAVAAPRHVPRPGVPWRPDTCSLRDRVVSAASTLPRRPASASRPFPERPGVAGPSRC